MAVLCVILAAVCCYDYRDKRIPNYLVLFAAFWGVGWRAWGGTVFDLCCFLAQAAAVMVLLYPFFKIGGLGAGDVKLLGVTAGYLPFEKILGFLFCSLLIAAVISLMKMWKGNIFRERISYFSAYLQDVMRSGSWKLYQASEGDSGGIRLSGPILASMLLYLGGVY